jgi:hypothetical protein
MDKEYSPMKIYLGISQWLAVLCVAALLTGCGNTDEADTPANPQQAASATDESEEHSHGTGPHDGALADWGGGAYHVEFTVDHDKQEATVYIVGGDEVSPAPIAAESIQLTIDDPAMQVALNAVPQEGDPTGTSSRFVGAHESLGVVQDYAGTISGVIEGTPYTGDFHEEPHEDH